MGNTLRTRTPSLSEKPKDTHPSTKPSPEKIQEMKQKILEENKPQDMEWEGSPLYGEEYESQPPTKKTPTRDPSVVSTS